MKIFLGFAFRDADKDLAAWCEQLFASLFAHTMTGERLGGEQLTPAVQDRINKCEALVALLTRRDARQDGRFTTHQWVLDELGYARAKNKPAIALVESGVEVGGMYQPNERIDFDRANPLPAFLRLAETVGQWKRALGRTLKVQLLPELLAQRVGATEDGIKCLHRLWSQGRKGPWVEVTPVPEGGGTFVWIEGVKDDDLIQLKVEGLRKQVWQSVATSQWMQVKLANGGGK